MKKLTDLEIQTQLADIVLDDWFVSEDVVSYWNDDTLIPGYREFDPLTDDALCFKLMVKHGVTIHSVECPAGSGKAYYANIKGISTDYQEVANRAICLAIIEAHKNE
ncbi:hypothetical protein [Pseudoalteromonas sp.]|uniref:hypothetical protein n=1 Tax=Pseudoalteromonas sp. TaxID=53249 RepID=UPI003566CA52